MYEGVVENEKPPPQMVAADHPTATATPPPPPAFFDNHHLPPHSWTQTLLGGLAGEDDKLALGLIQENNVDNWDQQLLGFSRKSKQDPTSQFSVKCNYSTGGVAKKAKIQHSSAKTSIIKVRKEKLGDRNTALHQLVSPFGKTDTATVLLEAIGYIKFLEKQIQALSVPYMGCGSGKSMRQQHHECDEEPKKDLRSRGLCLVPISCTLDVVGENVADYWPPTTGAEFR